jgi:hypothetical protein
MVYVVEADLVDATALEFGSAKPVGVGELGRSK